MKSKISEITDSTTIGELRTIVSKFIEERDWNQYHSPKALSTAISIESAELLENFLFKPDSHIPENIEDITDEMADIFIYLLSMANALNLTSFAKEIYRKMEKNRKKYPIEKYSGSNYQKQ
jgi:dCTP diphosphatase